MWRAWLERGGLLDVWKEKPKPKRYGRDMMTTASAVRVQLLVSNLNKQDLGMSDNTSNLNALCILRVPKTIDYVGYYYLSKWAVSRHVYDSLLYVEVYISSHFVVLCNDG